MTEDLTLSAKRQVLKKALLSQGITAVNRLDVAPGGRRSQDILLLKVQLSLLFMFWILYGLRCTKYEYTTLSGAICTAGAAKIWVQ